MPRPDLEAIGVKYRRIPVMAIGRDVYCDTRLMLDKLEQLFPEGVLGASQPDQKAVEKLLEKWTIDAGVFARASQLIPTSMPLLNYEKFAKDREEFSGRSWDKKQIAAMRPESLAHIRESFSFLERTLLADDREWILKTEKPSLADIEGAAHLPSLLCSNVLTKRSLSNLGIRLAQRSKRRTSQGPHLGQAVPKGFRVDQEIQRSPNKRQGYSAQTDYLEGRGRCHPHSGCSLCRRRCPN